jgi:hypothetical protein
MKTRISTRMSVAALAVLIAGCERSAEDARVPPEIVQPGDEALPAPAKLPDPVATVNGVAISKADLQAAVIRRFESQMKVRHTLVYPKALRASLEKRGLSVTDEEIESETAIILAKQQKTLEQFLEERRFDPSYLRQQVYYRVGILKLAYAANYTTTLDDLSALANAEADRLLFTENEIRWRWQGASPSAWVTVNGEPVSLDEAYRWSITWLNMKDVKKILNELIVSELDAQAIRRLGIEIPQDRFEEMMKPKFATAERAGMTLEEEAAFTGVSKELTEEHVRRFIGLEMILEREATDDRLTRFVESMGPAQGGYGPAVWYSEIVVHPTGRNAATEADWKEAERRIGEAKRRIDSGESFSLVARSMSTDMTVQQNAGDRGWVVLPEAALGEVEQRVVDLEKGAVSEPFRAGGAYRVVRLNDRRAAIDPSEILKDADRRRAIVAEFVRVERKPWHLRAKAEASIRVFF